MIDNMRRSWGVGACIPLLVFWGVIAEPLFLLFALFGWGCWAGTCFLLSLKGGGSK